MFVKEPCTVTAFVSRLLITAITSFEAEQRTLWNLQANQGAARRSEPSPRSAIFLRGRPFCCHLSQTERAQIRGDHQRQQDNRSGALAHDDCKTTFLQHTPVERTPDSTAQTPPRRLHRAENARVSSTTTLRACEDHASSAGARSTADGQALTSQHTGCHRQASAEDHPLPRETTGALRDCGVTNCRSTAHYPQNPQSCTAASQRTCGRKP